MVIILAIEYSIKGLNFSTNLHYPAIYINVIHFHLFHSEEFLTSQQIYHNSEHKTQTIHKCMCVDINTQLHTREPSLSQPLAAGKEAGLRWKGDMRPEKEVGKMAKALSNAILNCNVRQVSGRKRLKHTALLQHSSYLAHHLLGVQWHWAEK